MMAIKVFVTGVTGYIGGDVFYGVFNAHPGYEYTCLVRDSDKGAQVASQYPKVKLIYGVLDDVEKIENAAQEADIVLNCANADHEASAHAIVRGLSSTASADKQRSLIHTSGTGILMFKQTDLIAKGQTDVVGESSPDEVYDDWDGVSTLTSLPDTASHRKVDKIVIEASGPNLKTAIVCPPTIYGMGRGPGNQRGHQVNELARCTLERGHGIQVGKGQAVWTNIHVRDMTQCYVKLVKLASSGSKVEAWGHQGYYLTENGEHVWGDVSRLVAEEAAKQGLIANADVESVAYDEANRLTPSGAVLWGANSRGRSIRARKLLNWEPIEQPMTGAISAIVTSEAQRLGLLKGHAATVAK